jgi:hypothetical protein
MAVRKHLLLMAPKFGSMVSKMVDCGRVVEDNINNNHQPWDFAVHASVYGKVQAEGNVNPDNQKRKGKKKKLVLVLAGLSSY